MERHGATNVGGPGSGVKIGNKERDKATVTKDDVTINRFSVHAWSEEKALEYLKTLGKLLKDHNTPVVESVFHFGGATPEVKKEIEVAYRRYGYDPVKQTIDGIPVDILANKTIKESEHEIDESGNHVYVDPVTVARKPVTDGSG